jgi:gas vesicle GvpC-like protein
VVSLKASWQSQKKQRQQELVQRQQQVRESLTRCQQERQSKAAALRRDLNLFQHSLQQETQDFLTDVSLDRQLRSVQLSHQLHAFAQALQQQTADFLETTAADRSLMSQELAQDLSAFHAELNYSVQVLRKNLHAQMQHSQSETQTFLNNCQQQRHQNQIQLMQNLAIYIASLQEQVQAYLAELELARKERGQQMEQMLQESRDRRLAETAELFQQLSGFRAELRAYCNSLHESVWGNQVIQQLKPTVQKPTQPRSDRATQELAPTPIAQPIAQSTKPPITKISSDIPVAAVATIKAAVAVQPPTQPTLQQDNELLEQKIYSHIKQIEGARLTEIQSALGINRSQTVDSLRALIKQGLITQRDRVYLAQEEISL